MVSRQTKKKNSIFAAFLMIEFCINIIKAQKQ